MKAVHREGLAVPMATIAGDARVGVATLYRHFPTREDLLGDLTHRSFQRLRENLAGAAAEGGTATQVLRIFWSAVVRDADDLLLPLTGGPTVLDESTRAEQRALHEEIGGVLRRGALDGTIRREVEAWDIAWFGAMLAQSGHEGQTWEVVSLRLMESYLAGLGTS